MAKESEWQKDRDEDDEDEEDNVDRVHCVSDALAAYRLAKDGGRREDEADFRDLLTDMMHYAKQNGIDFDEELSTARMLYNYEC